MDDDLWALIEPTLRRRLGRWQQAGVFDRLHRILLAELNAAGELD
ncbi:hypothetical protein [Streptomyces sp. NPDC059874]